MTPTTSSPRPWDAVPLDVDGVLTLADHARACQRGAGCLICPRDDGVLVLGDRSPTHRRRRRRHTATEKGAPR